MANEYGPKFDASRLEMLTITKIARRAVKLAAVAGVKYDMLDAEMDVTACHCNGCPLDLQKLLDAPDSDFGHDVFGIRRFINRETGEIGGCFLPRCAMPQVTTV
jgi:hypothetical protein